MNKDVWIAGIIGLLLGVVLTMVYVPVWGERFGYQRRDMPMMRNNMMGGNQMIKNIDAHFIEQMIPHHESAVAMADIALQKAEHQEIKQLSENIKTSQTKEIEQMEQWYKDWFDKEFSLFPITSARHMGGMDMMSTMGDSSDLEIQKNVQPFDKVFIEKMIPHHQMAVMMAKMLQKTTERQKMKSLAHDIIDTQTKEIEQMREWYKTWYNQ